MDGLNSFKELNSYHQDGLVAEILLTRREQLFQVWSQQLHDQTVVLPARAVEVDSGQSRLRSKHPVQSAEEKRVRIFYRTFSFSTIP